MNDHSNSLLPPSVKFRFRNRTGRHLPVDRFDRLGSSKLRNYYVILDATLPVLVFILTLTLSTLVLPIESSDFLQSSGNTFMSPYNRNSGQFLIAQLCDKSQFPLTKRVEGAVITSRADIDVNCTITLRTKLAQQHFVFRFDELKLGCDDHLKLFDGDLDYGQPSIKDFSCRDSMASVQIMKTTGSFLTMRFSSDMKAKPGDGFKLVATAVFDSSMSDCPIDYAYCRNHLCISRSLFCDEIDHCMDGTDENNCLAGGTAIGGPGSSSFFGGGGSGPGNSNGELSLSNALGLLIVLVLIIFFCVIIFLSAIYCRRENSYAQYQHHLQRAIGVPLQTSSSLMFANHHQPQYHYFQPANMSPYVTPQHHAVATTTLPRGYSTLPLNLVRQAQVQGTPIANKSPQHMVNNEYLMMTGLTGPPTSTMQAAPTTQTSLYLPVSQSILATPLRQLQQAPTQQQQQQLTQQLQMNHNLQQQQIQQHPQAQPQQRKPSQSQSQSGEHKT